MRTKTRELLNYYMITRASYSRALMEIEVVSRDEFLRRKEANRLAENAYCEAELQDGTCTQGEFLLSWNATQDMLLAELAAYRNETGIDPITGEEWSVQ